MRNFFFTFFEDVLFCKLWFLYNAILWIYNSWVQRNYDRVSYWFNNLYSKLNWTKGIEILQKIKYYISLYLQIVTRCVVCSYLMRNPFVTQYSYDFNNKIPLSIKSLYLLLNNYYYWNKFSIVEYFFSDIFVY